MDSAKLPPLISTAKDEDDMKREDAPRRWHGILEGEHAAIRRAIIIVLCVLAASVPFGSLGFEPLADTHVLVSIIPVALACLLFGKWYGCAVGAIAGLAEMIHATYQPYNYYEKFFSLPLSSVVLMALLGLGLGALFACACRLPRGGLTENGEKTSGAARIGVITTACIAGAIFFTLFLLACIYMTDNGLVLNMPSELVARSFDLKGSIEQILFHAIIIALPCIVTDFAVGHLSVASRKPSLRTTFQFWFAAITVGFFFVASAIAYTAVTNFSIVNMNVALSDQLNALSEELIQRDAIVNTLDERGVLPRENLRAFAEQQYRNINCDLAGWSSDISVLATNDIIFASNNDALVGSSIASLVAPGSADAVFASAFESQHAVECYQGSGYEISYLFAIKTNFDHLGNQGVYQLVSVVPSSETFLNRALYMYLVAIVFAALLGTFFIVVMRLLKYAVVQPVDSANEALGRITAGELDQRVPDSSSSEFSSLAEGINTTVGALENSIAEANARIDRELAAARTIQQSALPTAQPPFPNIDSFDLYATMNPAREVGGDFYDYFDLGARGIGFVVADVSGKGMPAALFMMAAKTAIRGAMEAKTDLAKALDIANRSLCEGNESEMFVTAFAGIFDYRTGTLTYVNAGHNKPLLMHDGTWTWLEERSGPYLGSFDWIEYKEFEQHLEQGDELFAYTDGVNEAFNAKEELYGNARLETFLATHGELHPRRLLRSLRADLIGWSYGIDQSDDITMLALKYGIPPEHGASFITTASLDHFDEILDFVTQHLEAAGCPPKPSNHVLIAVEELVVNVCNYAYPQDTSDESKPLRVHFTWHPQPNAIVIEIGDDGTPFNPLEHEDPERPESIEEAKIGGLGLFMTKKFMDKIEYVREGIANVTIITKYWD